MIKILSIISFGLFISFNVFSTNIYLVRHAEKQKGYNPSLTEIGEERAKNLAYLLEKVHITRIFSTEYKRTMQTAKPLSDLLSIKVENYDPRNLKVVSEKLKNIEGNVLVVGHSNTTPLLTELISGIKVKELTEADYGDVYHVNIKGANKTLQQFQIAPITTHEIVKEDKNDQSEHGVNYVKISDRIDTSGQPPLQLLKRFSEKNYDLVVNLAPPLSQGSILQEGGLIAQTGTRYVNIPVDWEKPTHQDFKLFSHILNSPGANKVLVHCQINMRGSLFTFLYRVVHEKIDPSIAEEKMNQVWSPTDQWQVFAQMILDEHNIDFSLL